MTHWTKAAAAQDLDDVAAATAWHSLERYLGLSIRRHLSTVVTQLVSQGELLRASFAGAVSPADLLNVRRQLLKFRNRYSRVEMTLVFFADAINTRINPKIFRVFWKRTTSSRTGASGCLAMPTKGAKTPSALYCCF